MRAVLIALGSLLLTACNMVVSHEPLFTEADAAKAAPLKDGWWAAGPKAGCVFDTAGDARDWPECADGQLISKSRLIDTDKGGAPQAILVADGDPRILQVAIRERGFNLVAYMALKPLATDRGAVTAFKAWPIICGPPPPEPKDAKGPGDYATRRPFGGLTVDTETGSCWATAPAQVRQAAVLSLPLTKPEDLKEIRWVRAAGPGEEKARPKPPEPPETDDPDKMR